jgi:ureidoacrylate peracid hydrolase
VDPTTSALIVVDVQNDFCHSEGCFGKRGFDMGPIQDIFPPLRLLIRRRAASGFPLSCSRWSIRRIANGRPITGWSGSSPVRPTAVPTIPFPGPGVWGQTLVVEGTWGADLCEGFEPEPGDILLKKNRYGGFTGTNLDLILRSLGVKTILMTGVATNVCVESTAREGFMLDYNVVMVDDACATTSREEHEGTLLNCRNYFAGGLRRWMRSSPPGRSVV